MLLNSFLWQGTSDLPVCKRLLCLRVLHGPCTFWCIIFYNYDSPAIEQSFKDVKQSVVPLMFWYLYYNTLQTQQQDNEALFAPADSTSFSIKSTGIGVHQRFFRSFCVANKSTQAMLSLQEQIC